MSKYYTRGSQAMTSVGDLTALASEFDEVRDNLDTAFDAVEVDTDGASAHAASDGTSHANVVTNNAHVAGDGSDHANVATNDAHVAGDGSDHANVATNNAHVAMTSANPHGVTDALAAFTVALPGAPTDWVTAPPATISEALNRLAAHLVAGGGAAPGPIA
jgi:hypothetical protein